MTFNKIHALALALALPAVPAAVAAGETCYEPDPAVEFCYDPETWEYVPAINPDDNGTFLHRATMSGASLQFTQLPEGHGHTLQSLEQTLPTIIVESAGAALDTAMILDAGPLEIDGTNWHTVVYRFDQDAQSRMYFITTYQLEGNELAWMNTFLQTGHTDDIPEIIYPPHVDMLRSLTVAFGS